MQKKYKVLLIILASILLLTAIVFIGFRMYDGNDTTEIKHVDNILDYGYTLEERDSKLMKKVFSSLKSELKKDTVDYQKYAEYLSELYIIDLFTIDNKINKYDIPCLEYILDDSISNFSLNVEDTLYKYVEDNSNKNRKQDLPVVKNVILENIEIGDYTFNSEKYESFKVSLKWDYLKDFGYDTRGIVTLIKKDNKLFVVNYTADGGQDEESN